MLVEPDAKSCDVNAFCTNSFGEYTCTCMTGYSQFMLNEWRQFILNNGACTNTDSSHECANNIGYSCDGKVCEDVNKCLDNPCNVNGACANSDGTYSCSCNDGYSGDGFTCEDVNECDAGVCVDNIACTNLPGSFSCACLDGFESDVMDGCTDIVNVLLDYPVWILW